MNYRDQTLSSFFWRFLFFAGKGVLQILVLSIFARYITPKEFGLIGIAQAIIIFIERFSEIGLGPALIQKQKISQNHINIAFYSSIFFALIIYIILYFTAPFISSFFEEPQLNKVVKVISISFIFGALSVVPKSLFQKNFRFKKLSQLEFIGFAVGYGFVGIPMALSGQGLWTIVIAVITQNIIISIAGLFYYPPNFNLQFRWKEFKELYRFGVGLTLLRIFNFIGMKGDNITIGKVMNADMVGIYGRAFELMNIPNMYIGQSLNNVLFPFLAYLQNQKEKLSNVYIKSLTVLKLLLCPIAVTMYFITPALVLIVLGHDWVEMIPVLQILILTLPLRTSIKITDSLIRSTGAVYHSTWRKFIYACSVIGGIIVGATYNIKGVAWGINLAVIIHYFLMVSLASRETGFYLKKLVYTFLPALKLGGILVIFNLIIQYFLTPVLSPISELLTFLIVNGITVPAFLFLLPDFFGSSWKWFGDILITKIPSNKGLDRIKKFCSRRIKY